MKKTRTDTSGLPKSNLPPVPELDLVLYHWSPTSNRSSINKVGLLLTAVLYKVTGVHHMSVFVMIHIWGGLSAVGCSLR